MFKYFIWDYDGTLFDTYPAITSTYQEVLKKEYGIESNYDEIMSLAKVSLSFCTEKIADKFGINSDEFKDKLYKLYRENPVGEEPPFPGAREVCEFVKSAGGKNYIITHRDEKSMLESLNKYNMKGLFEDFITRDHRFPRKPDPQAFLFLIEKYHLDPVKIIGIGDRDIDIKAAKSAGIAACYINYEGLQNQFADFNIEDLYELKKLVLISR